MKIITRFPFPNAANCKPIVDSTKVGVAIGPILVDGNTIMPEMPVSLLLKYMYDPPLI